jgi:hypothetical protein
MVLSGKIYYTLGAKDKGREEREGERGREREYKHV